MGAAARAGSRALPTGSAPCGRHYSTRASTLGAGGIGLRRKPFPDRSINAAPRLLEVGIRLAWDPRRPAGRRLVSAEIGGEPLADAALYSVAVPGYLWRGGDGFTEFAGAKVLVGEESGPNLTQLVLDAVARRGAIAPQPDGRLRVVEP